MEEACLACQLAHRHATHRHATHSSGMTTQEGGLEKAATHTARGLPRLRLMAETDNYTHRQWEGLGTIIQQDNGHGAT